MLRYIKYGQVQPVINDSVSLSKLGDRNERARSSVGQSLAPLAEKTLPNAMCLCHRLSDRRSIVDRGSFLIALSAVFILTSRSATIQTVHSRRCQCVPRVCGLPYIIPLPAPCDMQVETKSQATCGKVMPLPFTISK